VAVMRILLIAGLICGLVITAAWAAFLGYAMFTAMFRVVELILQNVT